MKIESEIKDTTEGSILKAFDKLIEVSSEFEYHKDTYLGQDSIRAIKRSLKNKGFYEFIFTHFHTEANDIILTIKTHLKWQT